MAPDGIVYSPHITLQGPVVLKVYTTDTGLYNTEEIKKSSSENERALMYKRRQAAIVYVQEIRFGRKVNVWRTVNQIMLPSMSVLPVPSIVFSA